MAMIDVMRDNTYDMMIYVHIRATTVVMEPVEVGGIYHLHLILFVD